TASGAGGSTSPRPPSYSASARGRRSARASSARSPGTGDSRRRRESLAGLEHPRALRSRPSPPRGERSRALVGPGAVARHPLAGDRRLRPLGAPRRLALLPGRRPDLVLDDELAARARIDPDPARVIRLAARRAAARLDHRRELPRGPADRRPAPGRRAGPDRPLL